MRRRVRGAELTALARRRVHLNEARDRLVIEPGHAGRGVSRIER